MSSEERRGFGAMTGATGSLTPDDLDEPFVPAEQREIVDPTAARGVTASVHRRAARRQAEPTEAGALIGEDRIAPNDRGLAPDDPADRMEERQETVEPPARGPRRARATRIGGDVLQDPEKEHM